MKKKVTDNWICSRCHVNTDELYFIGKKLCRSCKEELENESKQEGKK